MNNYCTTSGCRGRAAAEKVFGLPHRNAGATNRPCSDLRGKNRSQHNSDVLAEAFDVSDAAAVARLWASVADKFGGVPTFVTNAGGPPAKGFLSASLRNGNAPLN